MPSMQAPTIDRYGPLPSALAKRTRWERLVDGRVPAMIVSPAGSTHAPAPVVLWMHGRTVQKEIDPGRFLRWMRAGIGACAVDLPGHGERFDPELQRADRTFDVVLGMIDEIDAIVDALAAMNIFDMSRIGIGGMSAGGMATLARLCGDHPFTCCSVEATTGAWSFQRTRRMFRERGDDEIERHDPLENLEGWRELPFQAFHTRIDEWVAFEGQSRFVTELQRRYDDPSLIEFIVYDETGAPFEHAGFGRHAASAKDAQRAFFSSRLQSDTRRPEH